MLIIVLFQGLAQCFCTLYSFRVWLQPSVQCLYCLGSGSRFMYDVCTVGGSGSMFLYIVLFQGIAQSFCTMFVLFLSLA